MNSWQGHDLDGDGVADIMTRTTMADVMTSAPVMQQYQVPRTVHGSRVENRTRTRMETKTRQIPETKYRTEVKYVPVSRQVPYQTTRTETYQEPRIENYQVTVPTQSTVMDTRTRTRYVQSTKKCNVRVPVYSARCGGGL